MKLIIKLKIRQSVIDMENMFDLTSIKTSIKDKSPDVPNLIVSPTASTIVFDKIRFQYVNGQDLFKDLSFEVPTGKKIAIVGGSGSGKSTIVRLLFRFYDPIEGRILINNQNIKDVSLKSLRHSIGIVPQVRDSFKWTDKIPDRVINNSKGHGFIQRHDSSQYPLWKFQCAS